MVVAPRRGTAIAFFVISCVCLVALAIALNVGWVVLNWRQIVPLLLGVPVFAAIITGLILNTTFLVREIRRNEQHNAFVNAVTHELKTPVTSIRLHLETLRTRGDTLGEVKRQEFYDVMLEDSDRLLRTIEQVLAAGQSDLVPLHRAKLDLGALAEECVTFTRTRSRLPPDAVRFVPAPAGADTAEIVGDASLLRGAILNLIDNAVKYSGDDVRVDVSATREGQRVRLRVRDHGAGLAPSEVKRIFGRFYRIPGPLTQRVKGSGLGLSIVRSAARRHGGHASAESEGVGRGATFCLDLPAAPPA
jgi:two-component system, OmpR family, sensor histidine kinase SenX3